MLSDQNRNVALFMWLTVELCQIACWGLYDMLLKCWESMGSGTLDRISAYLMEE